jgi:hypothetical protein
MIWVVGGLLGADCGGQAAATCDGYAIWEESDVVRFATSEASAFSFEPGHAGGEVSWPESWDHPYGLVLCNAAWEESAARLSDAQYRATDEVYLRAGSAAGAIDLLRGSYGCFFTDQGDDCDTASVRLSLHDVSFDPDAVAYGFATYHACDAATAAWIERGARLEAGLGIGVVGTIRLAEEGGECVAREGEVRVGLEQVPAVIF